MGLLDEATLTSEAAIEIRTEEIRQVMLNSMSKYMEEQAAPALWNKVNQASSIQTLWYLRIDLLVFLSKHCGEESAREQLSTITDSFRGVIPRNQMPKPGRFGR